MPVNHRGARALLIGAALVVVIAGLKAASEILAPTMMAAFLAILCVPPMRRLQSRGVPEWLALIIVAGVAALIVFLIGVVIGGSIDSFQRELPKYSKRIAELTGGLSTWLDGMGVDLGTEGLADNLNPEKLMGFVGDTLGRVISALSNTILVILTIIFILLEVNGMSRKIRTIMGGPEADLSEFSRGTQQVQTYLAVKTIVSLATGALVAILCFAVGVDFAMLWALLAFLFNFVPNIGSIIAAVPAVLLTLVQYGPGHMAIVAIGYFAINMVIGNAVEPKMLGRRLGLSTLVVFLSMVFWYFVWGPIGMLLSVPMTVIVKILLEHTEDFAWVAVLLGSGAEAEEALERQTAASRRAAESAAE
ncbi:MAG: AI-2E family transporter [Deltaproteobacteria bacterium]|nr:AI-2E family transporter [Deltaproteobacteria bacterium]